MLFERFEDSGLSQFSYAVGCPAAGSVAIVDPRRDVDVYEKFAADQGLAITHVLETHIHADFASGAHEHALEVNYRCPSAVVDAGSSSRAVGGSVDLRRQPAFLLGRDENVCDVVLAHPSCSGQHAEWVDKVRP